jgi:hypothetical protein
MIRGRKLPSGRRMSTAAERYIRYYLAYVESNSDQPDLIQTEFGQILRCWAMADCLPAESMEEADREHLLLDFVRYSHNFLALQGLWREVYVPWLERGLTAARRLSRGRDELSLLINLGVGYTDLGDAD